MNDKCVQGAVNQEGIKELKEQTKELFKANSVVLETLGRINEGVIKIQGQLDAERDHRIRLDNSFSEHLRGSEDRLKEMEANTMFRKIGVWVLGLGCGAIGWLVDKAFK